MTLDDDLKETIRKALSRAGDQRSLSAIAREIGMHRQRLYDFVSKGMLGRESLNKVHAWLLANEYLAATAYDSRKEAGELIAAELETLAAILKSREIPKEIKAEQFVSKIGTLAKDLNKYAALIRGSG